MTKKQFDTRMEDVIIHAVQTAHEADPPADLTNRIMARLHPKRPTLWTRLRLWFLRPRVLTVRPITAIPAMTLAVALLALAFVTTQKPVENVGPRLATVRFILHDADMHARKVSVIGSFNNWRAERSVMWYSSDAQAWVLEAQLPPGDHEYLFLVNGNQLVPDPNAPMTSDDGFGNRNSIVFVNGEHEQTL
ncbi:glycoside hydrolase family 13 domain protein [Pseudodesulfovibrio mercurii]|uniref:Glycoside hydrolase family 13 domain protein n=1 Tax=Pseudodesulfovibrio mercurii TaxID=641491 RepID=F0JE56_9BACT|nr:glycogen-binding domain-containing protein [Pseudodesulfovibrio mercurii]EGB14665.1 glycoside hydrolase family 13 domain protein [Pseudodesulfovibrio mercurii]